MGGAGLLGLGLVAGFSVEFLDQGIIDKKGIIGQVAFEQPTRFVAEAEGPLKPKFLDPWRGLSDFAGVEGESGADAEVDAWREEVFMASDPEFLFGATEADPDEVGAGLGDERADAIEFVVGPCAEGR